MSKSIFWVCLFMLAGCGSANDKGTINPAFTAYTNRFQTQAAKYNMRPRLDRVSVVLDTDKKTSRASNLGYCEQGDVGVVGINRAFWQDPSVSQAHREMVLFKFLAACAMFRTYRETKVMTRDENALAPSSLMTRQQPEVSFYEINHQAYEAELFTAKPIASLFSNGPSQFAPY